MSDLTANESKNGLDFDLRCNCVYPKRTPQAMTDTLRTRIAVALAVEYCANAQPCHTCRQSVDDLADAVIRELPELPVKISTEDQLDALPFLTVIREVRPLRKGIDYGGIYERRTSGWQCISGTWVERIGRPMLPVMVLWRGKDEQ